MSRTQRSEIVDRRFSGRVSDDTFVTASRSIWQHLYAQMGRRLHKSLRHDLARPGALRRRVSGSLVLATVFSLVVLLTAIALFAAGMAVVFWPDLVWPVRLMIAVPLIGLAWLGRPRWVNPPDESRSLADYPALRRLMQRIAERLHVETPARVVVSPEFNAGVGRYGWRGTTVFDLGLPLAAVLEPQELVALIGHELGHLSAGDPQRHWLIGSTVTALASWYDALRPKTLWASRPGFIEQIYAFLANILLVALASLIWPALWVLSLLLWRESQRAEYRADQIAAKLAGRAALAALLRKSGRADQIFEVVRSRALASRQRAGARDLITRIRDLDWRVPVGPPSEAEAGFVAERDAQANASHPPLTYRLDLVYAHAHDAATLTLTQGEFDAIQAELWAEAPRIEAQMIDRYLSRL